MMLSAYFVPNFKIRRCNFGTNLLKFKRNLMQIGSVPIRKAWPEISDLVPVIIVRITLIVFNGFTILAKQYHISITEFHSVACAGFILAGAENIFRGGRIAPEGRKKIFCLPCFNFCHPPGRIRFCPWGRTDKRGGRKTFLYQKHYYKHFTPVFRLHNNLC